MLHKSTVTGNSAHSKCGRCGGWGRRSHSQEVDWEVEVGRAAKAVGLVAKEVATELEAAQAVAKTLEAVMVPGAADTHVNPTSSPPAQLLVKERAKSLVCKKDVNSAHIGRNDELFVALVSCQCSERVLKIS